MRKYIFLGLFTAICVSILFMIPEIVKHSIVEVSITKMSSMTYNESVNASGEIEQKNKNEIKVKIPIVPENVNVKIGQRVNQGDQIATVDKEATEDAIFDIIKSGNEFISDEVVSVFSTVSESINLLKNAIPSSITAPSSGIITSLQLSKGNIADPSESIAVISDMENLQAKLSVNEKNIYQIEKGQKVVLTTEAFKNRPYYGYISDIYPSARKKIVGTSQEAVVDILVDLENSDGQVKPGFSVKGKIQVADEKLINIIPYEAVLQDDNGTEYVYVYSNGKALRKEIVTGIDTENGIEVKSGLDFDSKVIFNSKSITKDNSFVRIGS